MKIFPLLALAASTFGTSLLPALAAPAKDKTQSTKTSVRCPQCMMKMSRVKTAEMPAAVKVGGKTYYCCAACEDQSAKPVKAKPKTASIPKCPKCNMQMAAKPSMLKKTAMKVGGKTYYCCTICPKH